MSNQDFTLTDFFQIGRNAVRLFPDNPERKCLQLQTFRVLQEGNSVDLGAPNLGAVPTDKNTPFFWSRKWMRAKYDPNKLDFEYPLLYMYEQSSETAKNFGGGFKRQYRIELAVLDIYKADCTTGKIRGCSSRPINQIYLDTETLLDSVLAYFRQMVIATTDKDPTPKIYYLPYLQQQRENLKIRSFDPVRELVNSLSADNMQTTFERIENKGVGQYGTKCVISFSTNVCTQIDYKCELDEYGAVAFEAGAGATETE